MYNYNTHSTYMQYVGDRANAASTTTASVLYKPSDVATLQRTLTLLSGGTPAKPLQSKALEVKSTFADGTFDYKTKMPSNQDLKLYSWNLPPHVWSRPISPSTFDSRIGDSSSFDSSNNDINRRGRIYYYARVNSDWQSSTTPNTENKNGDPRYGFQFLWNPTEFSTSVSVNPDITPTAEDKFVKVAGAYPSGETLMVSFVIDRTNDLYCLRSYNYASKSFKATEWDYYTQYYSGYSFDTIKTASKDQMVKKIQALQQLGTLADLEYLYKAINGPGWVNAATGRESSDIGFLPIGLLKIEIGPVAYIGYVTGINVNHTRFTKTMVPIETQVSLGFNLMATAGLSSKAK